MMPPPGRRQTPILVFLLLAVFLDLAAGSRKQPPKPLPAIVQALKPTGLRISVLDEEGVDLVIINANINVPLEPKETGQFTRTVSRAKDGFWSLTASDAQLKPEDVVFYSVYHSTGGEGRYVPGHQLISELVDPSCQPSITTVNGQPTCKGAVVFEDNFDSLNQSVWAPHIQFSAITDNEFNTYVADKENSFTKDGFLHLKATLEPEEALTTPLRLEGCTSMWGGEFCERKPYAWNIRPPTRSARIISKPGFSFRFGRVEVRAKAAVGDWLHSRIWLESRDNEYGRNPFESGRVEIMRVVGNADLERPSGGGNYGANVNHVQVDVASCRLVYFFPRHHHVPKGLLTDDFHTYGVTWTPRGIKIDLDGLQLLETTPPRPGGFLDTDPYRKCENSAWEKGTFMAPFDKEFYFNFGLLVGGRYTFKDGSKSGEHLKPYVDESPRGPLNLWRARDEWLPTWKDAFKIDSVKVWAL